MPLLNDAQQKVEKVICNVQITDAGISSFVITIFARTFVQQMEEFQFDSVISVT